MLVRVLRGVQDEWKKGQMQSGLTTDADDSDLQTTIDPPARGEKTTASSRAEGQPAGEWVAALNDIRAEVRGSCISKGRRCQQIALLTWTDVTS